MPLEDNRDRYGHLLDSGVMREIRRRPSEGLQDDAAFAAERMGRKVGKHPALGAPYRLSDGTDISRMTADEIAVHQRRLSPKYPTLDEAAALRRDRRDIRLTQTCYALFAAGALLTFYDPRMGVGIIATAALSYMVITVAASWSRRHDK